MGGPDMKMRSRKSWSDYSPDELWIRILQPIFVHPQEEVVNNNDFRPSSASTHTRRTLCFQHGIRPVIVAGNFESVCTNPHIAAQIVKNIDEKNLAQYANFMGCVRRALPGSGFIPAQ